MCCLKCNIEIGGKKVNGLHVLVNLTFHKYFFRLLDWRRCLVINMSFPLSLLVNTDASQLSLNFSVSHVNENV